MTHTINSNTLEAEEDRALKVWGQHNLYSEFQASLSSLWDPVSETKQSNNKNYFRHLIANLFPLGHLKMFQNIINLS